MHTHGSTTAMQCGFAQGFIVAAKTESVAHNATVILRNLSKLSGTLVQMVSGGTNL